MKEYDFIIVGSGVGLSVIGQAINQGLKCALIESGKMGGTCLTRGCIPSKVLVYPADIIREAQHVSKIGLQFSSPKIDWDLISKRMWSQIDESKEIEKGLAQAPNLTVYHGIGEFVGEYQMRVALANNKGFSETFKGKKIILASGGRSWIPPVRGIEEIGYITSESFFSEKYPKSPWKSLIILGGGIIAAEFAHIFSAFGTEVTIVEMLPRIVSTEEPEVSAILERAFRKHMKVLTNFKAVAAKKEGQMKVLTIENVANGQSQDLYAEEILVAAGRKSNADILKVEKTGVKVDAKGWIQTDQYFETTKKNIWAIGDANGKFQFRHKANYDAELVTQNIFGEPQERKAYDYSAVPWAIYTYPRIAHVGMTQKEAMDTGHQILVAVKKYSSVAKGFAMGLDGDEDGLFKLIVDKNYMILGASAIGPEADLLIQQITYLMNAGFACGMPEDFKGTPVPKIATACPEGGSFMPIYRSMVIHPSLNEVAGWAIGNLRPVNIQQSSQHHHDH